VWRISSDGAPTPLKAVLALSDVRLFPATAGGAVLWTGTRWLAFDPWSEAFTAMSDGEGPRGEAISPELGVGVWLVDDGTQDRVAGRRWSVRNAYATELRPLLGGTLGPLAPDRSPYLAGITFDPGRGLALPEGATVFVADGRYATFSLDVDLADGAPPSFVLRDGAGTTYEIGGADCPLVAAAPSTLHVLRSGPFVAIGVDGKPPVTCARPAPEGRVAIGLRGHVSTLRNLKVARPAIK
jgi:hypothetical protein